MVFLDSDTKHTSCIENCHFASPTPRKKKSHLYIWMIGLRKGKSKGNDISALITTAQVTIEISTTGQCQFTVSQSLVKRANWNDKATDQTSDLVISPSRRQIPGIPSLSHELVCPYYLWAKKKITSKINYYYQCTHYIYYLSLVLLFYICKFTYGLQCTSYTSHPVG